MNPAKGMNFTGTVDLGINLNGIDTYQINDGFTYYNQAIVTSMFPKYGPSKGKGIIKVFGDNFKEDFKNAKPSKRDYRHFNVKTVEGPNDFDTMKEVIHRRYKRLLDEGDELPQLIVIDGGNSISEQRTVR